MKERLSKLEEIFLAQFMLATGDQLNSIASVRYSFASRLYYRTLLSMLKQVSCDWYVMGPSLIVIVMMVMMMIWHGGSFFAYHI